jgi:hypothetical protein
MATPDPQHDKSRARLRTQSVLKRNGERCRTSTQIMYGDQAELGNALKHSTITYNTRTADGYARWASLLRIITERAARAKTGAFLE